MDSLVVIIAVVAVLLCVYLFAEKRVLWSRIRYLRDARTLYEDKIQNLNNKIDNAESNVRKAAAAIKEVASARDNCSVEFVQLKEVHRRLKDDYSTLDEKYRTLHNSHLRLRDSKGAATEVEQAVSRPDVAYVSMPALLFDGTSQGPDSVWGGDILVHLVYDGKRYAVAFNTNSILREGHVNQNLLRSVSDLLSEALLREIVEGVLGKTRTVR